MCLISWKLGSMLIIQDLSNGLTENSSRNVIYRGIGASGEIAQRAVIPS